MMIYAWMLCLAMFVELQETITFGDDDDYRVEVGFGFLQAMSLLLFDSHLLFKKVIFNL